MFHRQNLKKSHPVIQVHLTRGNVTESVHLVDAVVVDEKGALVTGFGEAEKISTFPRSSIKMIQALSFIESGAHVQWDLDQRHIALACASHNGEAKQTDLVMNWLERIQCHEEDLVCGAHAPYHEETAHELIRQGADPKRRHNNCSGKHTSMLCTMKTLKIDHRGYEKHDHDLQKRLRRILSEMSGEDFDKAQWGIDGCGIPTYQMSLRGVAKSLAALIPNAPVISEDRKSACQIIREAVLKHPYFVGGEGDFCSDLMMTASPRLIVKSGAEGVYAGVMLQEGLSFALKVRDGHARGARVATSYLLKKLGGLTESEYLKLSSHTEPDVKNWEGLSVGKIFVPSN
jgi:L-asparaginase II